MKKPLPRLSEHALTTSWPGRVVYAYSAKPE